MLRPPSLPSTLVWQLLGFLALGAPRPHGVAPAQEPQHLPRASASAGAVAGAVFGVTVGGAGGDGGAPAAAQPPAQASLETCAQANGSRCRLCQPPAAPLGKLPQCGQQVLDLVGVRAPQPPPQLPASATTSHYLHFYAQLENCPV